VPAASVPAPVADEITKPEPKFSEAELSAQVTDQAPAANADAPASTDSAPPARAAPPARKERRMQPRRQPFSWAMPEPKPDERDKRKPARHELVVAVVVVVIAVFVYLALRM
jgi:hypothetical protein